MVAIYISQVYDYGVKGKVFGWIKDYQGKICKPQVQRCRKREAAYYGVGIWTNLVDSVVQCFSAIAVAGRMPNICVC